MGTTYMKLWYDEVGSYKLPAEGFHKYRYFLPPPSPSNPQRPLKAQCKACRGHKTVRKASCISKTWQNKEMWEMSPTSLSSLIPPPPPCPVAFFPQCSHDHQYQVFRGLGGCWRKARQEKSTHVSRFLLQDPTVSSNFFFEYSSKVNDMIL